MKERKIQSKERYLAAFINGTLIFIMIFLFSYSLSYLEFQRISNLQENTAYEIFEDKLDYSLFDEKDCDSTYSKISADLGFQGRVIDDLERKLGKGDSEVLFRKRFYSLIILEHFEFVKILNDQCNLNISTIFFFYSNKANDLEKSEKLGRLLGIVSERRSNLVIYSFDINLESDLVDKLENEYGVEESGTLVFGNGDKLISPQRISEIENHLD